jgi:hypothetical protein
MGECEIVTLKVRLYIQSNTQYRGAAASTVNVDVLRRWSRIFFLTPPYSTGVLGVQRFCEFSLPIAGVIRLVG